nr:HlyD family efflux transporter periplasmic adaptor subunit [uncultured Cellulosilyticum sp.]
MQPIIKNIQEITDSKEMYESKPHRFLSYFIYILLISIILAGVWMYFGEIDVVSKGTGVVRPNENISSVRNKVQGEITASYLEEGKQVQKGEVLFTVAYDDLEISRLKQEELIKDIEVQLERLKKLRDSIEQDKNLFSKTEEKEYYERYIKYTQDFENLKNANQIASKNETISASQTDINKQIYENKILEYDNTLKELTDYKASITQGENVFENKTCAYALAFDTYIFEVRELEQEVMDKKVAYELNCSLDEENLVAKKELESSKAEFEAAQNKLVSLKVSALGEVERKIEEIKLTKTNAEQEKSKLVVDETLLAANEEQRQLSLKKYKTDILVELNSQIEEMEQTYRTGQRELERIEVAIADCSVVAPIDGTIHIGTNISTGDLISAGADIATIIPMSDSLYKIEIFMPNREIAGIEVGDQIKYKFDALPYKEYGQLEGEIQKISTDAKVSESQGISGYLVEGSIAKQTVYSYKGEAAEIKVGMTCEAHVITEQKKILYYLLEKINLMD